MEAVFSIPTSLTITETGDSVMVHGNVTVGSIHSNSVKYTHPTSLGISHSDHTTVNLDPLTPPVSLSSITLDNSADNHLMHFTDDLNLCIKPSPDNSSLVDDEDEDVRSLLAAAVAAGANASEGPPTPHSSSGLNTPPDTGTGRSMSSLSCNTLKGGLCNQEQTSELLVSRLNISRTDFTDSDDLSILIPPSSQHNAVNYLVSCGVSTPSNSPLMFNPQSPSTPLHVPTCLSTSHLHIGQSSVMLHSSSLPNESHSLGSECINSYSVQFPTSNKPIIQNESFISHQTEDQLFSSSLSLLNGDIHSPPSSSTTLSSSSSPTRSTSLDSCKLSHANDMPHIVNPSGLDITSNSTNVQNLVKPVKCEVYLRTESSAVKTESGDCVTNNQVDTCTLLDDDFDPVSKATAENLMDLEQVISSHSASLLAVDDEFIIHPSRKEFDISANNEVDHNNDQNLSQLNSNNGTCSELSAAKDMICFKEPNFPEVYVDLPNVTELDMKLEINRSPKTGNISPNIGTPVKSECDDAKSNSENSDCLLADKTDSFQLNNCTALNENEKERTFEALKLEVADSKKREDEDIDNINKELHVCEPTHLTETDTMATVSTCIQNVKLSDEESLAHDDSNTHIKHSPEHISKDNEVYNDAEYAAAAVAAVYDVVYALAGNRKPDPSLTLDPALEGTGTDRIYTLNLAPVYNEVNSYTTNNICTSNHVHSSSFGIANSNLSTITMNTPIQLSTTGNNNLQCVLYQNAYLSNENSQSQSGVENCISKSINVTNSLNWSKSDIKGEFACLTCHKIFPQRALLLKHRIMHEEPKHICETCGRSFLREDKLKRHIMSIHTAEKPHICVICSKAFSRKDKLKDHLKHHERAARNFECQQCQQPFVQKSDLNRHIRGVHQGEPGVGINMIVKRKAPGTTPLRLNKRKLKISSLDGNGDSVLDSVKRPNAVSMYNYGNSMKITDQMTNGNNHDNNGQIKTKIDSLETELSIHDQSFMTVDPGNADNIKGQSDTTAAVVASIAAVAASLSSLPITMTPSVVTQATHPVFAAGASGLMLPTMAFTQAHHHFVQQQQQAAAVMLPGTGMASMTAVHPSALTLQQQQQQQQFFAMAAIPALAQSVASQSSEQQQLMGNIPNAHQTQIHFQPELKTVNTPSGPMMVLTRIAATNQAGQVQQLAGQTVFPQVVGFHASAMHQQQLQQLQQQQQVAVVHQQQQQHQQHLIQQQQANYAVAAAAAAAGTHLVAVSSQHITQNAPATNQSITSQAQHFQLQQQQHQAAAFAAQQQAAHSFLFPTAASGATVAGTPTAFFCHPPDSMTAGLILASSADPASFALAAAAQAAAVAAQQQTVNANNGQNASVNAISASALAAAAGLQTVTGYTSTEAQQTLTQQQLQHHHQQQQLLLQQQHHQRLAAAAAAVSGSTSTHVVGNHNSTVLMSPGVTNTIINGNPTSLLHNSNQEDQMTQSAQFVMAQHDVGSVNNYQLAAFTNAAAALYQQHHPGFMLASVGGTPNVVTAGTGSATVAAMALQQQQQYHQQHHQQQVGLMAAAAYQQQQQQVAAHHHALQQQQQQ